MADVDWERIADDDFRVPADQPLAELTSELTEMLGSPDPEVRENVATATLVTWVARAVYDDLLPGLGDGMAAGLRVGLGATDGHSGLRRAASAVVLAACIERDNGRPLVLGGKVLQWGDALATWMLRERDLRAVARAGDTLATLARSPHLGPPELTVILDVVADRVLADATQPLSHRTHDQLVLTTLAVLRRGSVPMNVVEPWINRIAAAAGTDDDAQGFLRALYLQLALGGRPPAVRADLMLVLVGVLRASNPTWT